MNNEITTATERGLKMNALQPTQKSMELLQTIAHLEKALMVHILLDTDTMHVTIMLKTMISKTISKLFDIDCTYNTEKNNYVLFHCTHDKAISIIKNYSPVFAAEYDKMIKKGN